MCLFTAFEKFERKGDLPNCVIIQDCHKNCYYFFRSPAQVIIIKYKLIKVDDLSSKKNV